MFRFILLFSLTLLTVSVQWQTYIGDESWKHVFIRMRPEFVPEEVKEVTKDPFFSIPLDLQEKVPEVGTVILVDFSFVNFSFRIALNNLVAGAGS